MFHGRVEGAANTVGLYVDESHPVFDGFPTEFFGDCQWYNLMKNSRAVILDGAPEELQPMAQNIDHIKYSRKLGSIFEAKVGEGSLLVCTMDIMDNIDKYPEVRQLYNSMLDYVRSDKFAPQTELTMGYLATIFKTVISNTGEVSAYDDIRADGYSYADAAGELTAAADGTVSGISAGDLLRFDGLRFEGNGADAVNITGTASADAELV